MKTTDVDTLTVEQLKDLVKELERQVSVNTDLKFVQYLRTLKVKPDLLSDFLTSQITQQRNIASIMRYQAYDIEKGLETDYADILSCHILIGLSQERRKADKQF